MNRRAKIGLLLFTCCVCIFLSAAKAPVAHTQGLFVNDYAGVITVDDRAQILAIAQQLEQQTGAQMAVLTVSSLDGSDIESYAYSVAEGWGLGKKGEDNGVLIVLAVEDRLSRIEVGYGLEGTLTDILTGRIQDDYMIPHFSQDDYSTGLREGAGAVAATVYRHYGLEAPEHLPVVQEQQDSIVAGASMVLLLLLLILFIGGRGRRGGVPFLFFPPGGGRGGGGYGGGSFGGGGGFGGGGSSRRF